MNKLKLTVAMSLFAAAISGNVNAQDTNTDGHTITVSIPEVALVDIEPAATKNITLGFTAPTEAGNPIIQVQPTILYGSIILPSNLTQILPAM